MAFGGAETRLPPSGMSNSASFSSFSIRSLLNLPEDTVKGQGKLPGKSTQVPNCYSPCYPLVPRPVRAIASFPNLSLCAPNLRFPFDGNAPLHSVVQMGYFPFRSHGFLLGMELFQRRGRRPLRKKKLRPLFSKHQVQTMEEEFAKCKYVTEKRRSELALQLNMTETQVKTWFQNRRTKWKKEKKNKSQLTLPELRDNYGEVMLQTLPKRNMNCYGIQCPLVQGC